MRRIRCVTVGPADHCSRLQPFSIAAVVLGGDDLPTCLWHLVLEALDDKSLR